MNDRERRELMRALIGHPAWVLLVEEFGRRREAAVNRMLVRETTDEARREAAAEARGIDALLRWPGDQAYELTRKES